MKTKLLVLAFVLSLGLTAGASTSLTAADATLQPSTKGVLIYDFSVACDGVLAADSFYILPMEIDPYLSIGVSVYFDSLGAGNGSYDVKIGYEQSFKSGGNWATPNGHSSIISSYTDNSVNQATTHYNITPAGLPYIRFYVLPNSGNATHVDSRTHIIITLSKSPYSMIPGGIIGTDSTFQRFYVGPANGDSLRLSMGTQDTVFFQIVGGTDFVFKNKVTMGNNMDVERDLRLTDKYDATDTIGFFGLGPWQAISITTADTLFDPLKCWVELTVAGGTVATIYTIPTNNGAAFGDMLRVTVAYPDTVIFIAATQAISPPNGAPQGDSLLIATNKTVSPGDIIAFRKASGLGPCWFLEYYQDNL